MKLSDGLEKEKRNLFASDGYCSGHVTPPRSSQEDAGGVYCVLYCTVRGSEMASCLELSYSDGQSVSSYLTVEPVAVLF